MRKSWFSRSPRYHMQLQNLLIEIVPSQTVLQNALLHGIQIPHGCQAGGCGMCKCRLIRGKVEQIIENSAKLTESELNNGFIFACCCVSKTDLQIEVMPDTAAVATKGHQNRQHV